jgi:hypothetical protein
MTAPGHVTALKVEESRDGALNYDRRHEHSIDTRRALCLTLFLDPFFRSLFLPPVRLDDRS